MQSSVCLLENLSYIHLIVIFLLKVTDGDSVVTQSNSILLPVAYNISAVKSEINSRTLADRQIDVSSKNVTCSHH